MPPGDHWKQDAVDHPSDPHATEQSMGELVHEINVRLRAERDALAADLAAAQGRILELTGELDSADRELDYRAADLAAAHADNTRLRDALTDEIAMAEQSIETLRDLRKNWRLIVEKQDPDGGPLIENILYWLIEDVDPSSARAALASAGEPATEDARG